MDLCYLNFGENQGLALWNVHLYNELNLKDFSANWKS